MRAGYIEGTGQGTTAHRANPAQKPVKRGIATVLLLFLAMIPLTGFVVNLMTPKAEPVIQSSHAFDVSEWLVCDVFGDTLVEDAYQVSQTDILPLHLFSRSHIGSGRQLVDSGLNSILDFTTGPSFAEVNDWVLEKERTLPDGEEEFSRTAKVSPYDRFGVNGMTWTGYGGEWRYLHINACDPESSHDPELNKFYEDRLLPLSSYSDVSTSQDVRTQVYEVPIFQKYGFAVGNIIANAVFWVAKLTVVITTALSSLAFSDVPSLLGLTDIIAGSDGNTGIVGSLSLVFQSLVIIAVLITAGYMVWKGIFKREYRNAMGMLFQTILCFVIAIAVFAAPRFFVPLPNNIAVVGQSLLMSVVNIGSIGGNGMCTSHIGEFEGDELIGANEGSYDPETAQQMLTGISTNVSSSIGCALWQTFLLRPWAIGQFGTEWENVYAESYGEDDFTPETFSGDVETLGNTNQYYVGHAYVPLGDDEGINNWALFHISTMTDVHYDMDTEGEKPSYSSGVNNDWWRIVDALSNYDVTTQPVVDADGNEVDIIIPDTSSHPTAYWNDWTGMNVMNRMGTAFTAVLVAIMGSLGLLVFSGLAVIYSIGLSLLVAFAPIFFLFGCWPGRGQDIFKSWLSTLMNTILLRIGVGLLFVLMLAITVAAMDAMETIGWFQAIMTLAILSFLLVKNRQTILDTLAAVRLGSVDFSKPGKAAMQTAGTALGTTRRIGSAAMLGGLAGGYTGYGFGRGMKAGAGDAARDAMYKNQFLRRTASSMDTIQSQQEGGFVASVHGTRTDAVCAGCGKVLEDARQVYQATDSTLLYCWDCGENFNQELGGNLKILSFSGKTLAETRAKNATAQREESRDGRSARPKDGSAERSDNVHSKYHDYSDPRYIDPVEHQEQLDKRKEAFDENLAEINGRRSTGETDAYQNKIEELKTELKDDEATDEDKQWVQQQLKDLYSRGVHRTADEARDAEIAREGMQGLIFDIERHKELLGLTPSGEKVATPEIPAEIKPYISPQQMAAMYANQDYELITEVTKQAWMDWYTANSSDGHSKGYEDERPVEENEKYRKHANPENNAATFLEQDLTRIQAKINIEIEKEETNTQDFKPEN